MVQKTENVRKQTEVCDRWAPIIRNRCEAGVSARCGKAQNRLHTAAAASSGSLTGRRKANLNFYKRSFQLLFNWLSGPDTRTFPSALSLRKLEGDLYFKTSGAKTLVCGPGKLYVTAAHHLRKVLRVDPRLHQCRQGPLEACHSYCRPLQCGAHISSDGVIPQQISHVHLSKSGP